MFRTITFFIIIAYLYGCSSPYYGSRKPAASEICTEKFDKIFMGESDFTFDDFGGRVFDCSPVVRERNLIPLVFTFSKIGFLPMPNNQLIITIGDGTDEGTIDSVGLIKDGFVLWNFKDGRIEVHANENDGNLYINQYSLVTGKAELAGSFFCTTPR